MGMPAGTGAKRLLGGLPEARSTLNFGLTAPHIVESS